MLSTLPRGFRMWDVAYCAVESFPHLNTLCLLDLHYEEAYERIIKHLVPFSSLIFDIFLHLVFTSMAELTWRSSATNQTPRNLTVECTQIVCPKKKKKSPPSKVLTLCLKRCFPLHAYVIMQLTYLPCLILHCELMHFYSQNNSDVT